MKLEAREVTFRYPGKRKHPVLQGVSLSIAPGERVGLRAPSGSGKTTLCRLLAGYEKPQQGEILLDGRPLRDYRGVCPVQMVWQHPEPWWTRYCGWGIRWPRQARWRSG